MDTADEVLSLHYVSYWAPLVKARKWTRSGDDALKREAVVLLRQLRERYPHALEIGQELALALLECSMDSDARRVLQDLDAMCHNANEEILCRWGRLYKDNADRYLRFAHRGPEAREPEPAAQPAEEPTTAALFYRLALEKYAAAYQIRFGHYPGINTATLHLMLAALSTEPYLQDQNRQESEDIARDLLKRRAVWPQDLAEDIDVWHPATEAEARLLLQEWDGAAQLYRSAQSAMACERLHRESMQRQAVRILYCFRRLGLADTGPFDDLAEVFPD